MPFDAYTLYYVGQALYQVGGDYWQQSYPTLRDYLVGSQIVDLNNPAQNGVWSDRGQDGGGRVGGKPGELYGTAVACFILAIPNRYLPILQEGKIESLRTRQPGAAIGMEAEWPLRLRRTEFNFRGEDAFHMAGANDREN